MNGTPLNIPDPETGCNYAGVVVIKIAVSSTGEVFEAELSPNNQIPSGLTKSKLWIQYMSRSKSTYCC